MQRILQRYCLPFLILLLPQIVWSQIIGKVYDYSGVTAQSNAGKERAIPGIYIKVYGLSETGKQELIAQTQTDNKGNYSLNIPEGKSVKLCEKGNIL